MNTRRMMLVIVGLACVASAAYAQTITLETAPPVVVRTTPGAGETHVDPKLSEIHVTFSKAMADQSWSWVQMDTETFPQIGTPYYMKDNRTCVLPVRLEPHKLYVIWINYEGYEGFRDPGQHPAVPYLLTFTTGGGAASPAAGAGGQAKANQATGPAGMSLTQKPAADGVGAAGQAPSAMFLPGLNAEQQAVLEWTDRQFGSYFDGRSFANWSEQEKQELEAKLIDALAGPENKEYYQAINTLAALKTTSGLPALRKIAYSRADKNNRDRWMAIRALGILGHAEDVPELIHLVYHGNVNTHFWAQISLVRITGQNFGSNWEAWGIWWNGQNGQPPYKPEIIRWWSGQPETEKLGEQLAESDKKFLESLKN
jgi:RNA polymerase sigma-70 factor (ECF subfamily)